MQEQPPKNKGEYIHREQSSTLPRVQKILDEEQKWRDMSSVVVSSKADGTVRCSKCGPVSSEKAFDAEVDFDFLRQRAAELLRKAHLKGHIEGWIK